jgi:hypothetical protein
LSVRKKEIVSVVEKNFTGWWFIDSKEGQGYVPHCILMPLDKNLSSQMDFQPFVIENRVVEYILFI